MKFQDSHYRTIWMKGASVFMIDQNALPFEFRIAEAKTYPETCEAIRTMTTRGAGAIGAAAGFAMAQAFLQGADIEEARREIEATRPTARNLFFATERVYCAGCQGAENAFAEAQKLAEENIAEAKRIGEFGNTLIKPGARILTHCNAGWLGFVDYGSALSPMYAAHEQGKNIFVYADETRPRNQGARLTAWELSNQGVEHCIVPDNAGAYLMSQGLVDMVIVGADRIAANGDIANKIGTYEKAIVAKQFGVPFYVAAPFSTIDFGISDGSQIPIEQRHENEVLFATGPDSNGAMHTIRLASPGSHAINPAFDVTPAQFITAFITEKGILKPGDLS